MQVVVNGDFSDQYTIDSYDFWVTYGWMIESGGDDLLQLYKSKEVYSKEWKGQNGKQYDLSKRFFEDKVVTLSGYLIAENEADFWTKYLSLWDLLKLPGTRYIYSFELKQTVSAFYLDSPNSKRFTRLVDHPGKIAMKLDIQFQVMYMEMEPPTSSPRSPIVNAGPDKIITLPANQVPIFQASARARGSASLTTLLWELEYTSPVGLTAAIMGYSTINPTIFSLNSAGIYSFKLTVTDSNGLSSVDTMQINVLPEQIEQNNKFTYTFPFNLS